MVTPGETGGRAETPLPSFRLETLKKRVDFKAAQGGARFPTPGFTLLRGPDRAEGGPRFGFTVTKKLGNAVIRNRIRRRLREAVRHASGEFPEGAMDFVLLARSAALGLSFADLVRDVGRAVRALAARKPQPREKPD